MSRDLNEFADLAEALREARPTPEPEFTESLDRAVADHFPPEWAEETALGSQGRGRIGSPAERLRRWIHRSRVLMPTLVGAVGVLFVVAVAVSTVDTGRFAGDDAGSQSAMEDTAGSSAAKSEPTAGSNLRAMSGGYARSQGQPFPDVVEEPQMAKRAGASQLSSAPADSAQDTKESLSPRQRDVARKAEITLGTDPSGVQDVANEVISVTDDHKGIVMNSNVTDGEAGVAGATFKLLIPSTEIESAVADLSEIADLRSRNQELTDITSPTNKAEDDIADSKAKIKSLLGELETTYDETERASIERRIRWERYDLRSAETRLSRLERRADYTPIALDVETSEDSVSDDGSWGLSDAVDDAGKLLGAAAGVAVLALAVAIPIGLVILIALALNRAWVNRSRRRALGDD